MKFKKIRTEANLKKAHDKNNKFNGSFRKLKKGKIYVLICKTRLKVATGIHFSTFTPFNKCSVVNSHR